LRSGHKSPSHTFEGLDGCGKGTQIARLREHLGDVEAVFTREPTDGPHGRQIRAAARKGDPVAPEQELAWFTQDRREHVDSVIEPALAAGKLVITDRYYLSTVAYQGARGLDWQEILRDSEAAYPIPDLLVLLTLDAESAMQRVDARGAARDPLFERADFLARAAEIFAAIERPYITRVDGTRREVEVARAVQAAVDALLEA
jgi:dTMP kinase